MKPAHRVQAYRSALRAECRSAAAELHRRLVAAGAARCRLQVALAVGQASADRLAELSALRTHRLAGLRRAMVAGRAAFSTSASLAAGPHRSARRLFAMLRGALKVNLILASRELRAEPITPGLYA